MREKKEDSGDNNLELRDLVLAEPKLTQVDQGVQVLNCLEEQDKILAAQEKRNVDIPEVYCRQVRDSGV